MEILFRRSSYHVNAFKMMTFLYCYQLCSFLLKCHQFCLEIKQIKFYLLLIHIFSDWQIILKNKNMEHMKFIFLNVIKESSEYFSRFIKYNILYESLENYKLWFFKISNDLKIDISKFSEKCCEFVYACAWASIYCEKIMIFINHLFDFL